MKSVLSIVSAILLFTAIGSAQAEGQPGATTSGNLGIGSTLVGAGIAGAVVIGVIVTNNDNNNDNSTTTTTTATAQ